jgi:hypothetical protein
MKVAIFASALALGVLGAGTAVAQTVINEPTVMVGSSDPTPESPAIARKEAAAALAQAKRDCRRQGDRSAQGACLSQAREDYRQMMSMAGSRGGQRG